MTQIEPIESISFADLEIGPLYITKSGKVLLYLGKDKIGKHIFYTITSVPMINEGNRLRISHELAELKFLIPRAQFILTQMPEDEGAISDLVTLPNIVFKIAFLTQQEVRNLYANKRLLGTSKVVANFDTTLNKIVKRVLVKDVKPYHIYVNSELEVGTPAEGDTGAYIYLGHSSSQGHRYLYIFNLRRYRSKRDLDEVLNHVGTDNIAHFKQMIDMYEPIYYARVQDYVDLDLLINKGFV